ncbi:MAG: response regulator transcription factor [Burkholderiales bacterium]|jgi:DNA-binding CsgD family transcriptional regulator|nr:response regulator transcription factor [Burkholderiales bacterium]
MNAQGGTMNMQTAPTMIALTQRELDVLRLLASGCTYLQIATQLGISPHTVVSHIKNTYRKLEVHNAAGAVMRAMQLGVFDEATLQ